jgi:hypothetical protein
MKKIAFLTLFILGNILCYADPEPPVIYGIVKVILQDNSSIEGVLILGYPNADYSSYVSANAVYWDNSDKNGMLPLSIDMNYLSINSQGRPLYGSYNNSYYPELTAPSNAELKINFLTRTYSPQQNQSSFVHDNSSNTISFEQVSYAKYKTSDSLIIETDFDFLHKKTKTTTIAISDVMKIEWIKSPSQTWIDKVKTTHEEYVKADNEYELEMYEPLWYHEIIPNAKKFYDLIIQWEK